MASVTIKSRRGEDIRDILGKAKDARSEGSHGLLPRDEYVLTYAPSILAALVVRRSSNDTEKLDEQAIAAVGHLYDVVEVGERGFYILQHAPTVLAGLVIRRATTDPIALTEQAISGIGKLYDIVHELDTPAATMLSQPISEGS